MIGTCLIYGPGGGAARIIGNGLHNLVDVPSSLKLSILQGKKIVINITRLQDGGSKVTVWLWAGGQSACTYTNWGGAVVAATRQMCPTHRTSINREQWAGDSNDFIIHSHLLYGFFYIPETFRWTIMPLVTSKFSIHLPPNAHLQGKHNFFPKDCFAFPLPRFSVCQCDDLQTVISILAPWRPNGLDWELSIRHTSKVREGSSLTITGTNQ